MGTSFWPRIMNIMVLKGEKWTKNNTMGLLFENNGNFEMLGLYWNFAWWLVFDQGSRLLWSWRGKMDQKQHNGPIIVWEQWKFRNARIKLKFRVGISFWPRIMDIMVLKEKNRPKARQWAYCLRTMEISKCYARQNGVHGVHNSKWRAKWRRKMTRKVAPPRPLLSGYLGKPSNFSP